MGKRTKSSTAGSAGSYHLGSRHADAVLDTLSSSPPFSSLAPRDLAAVAAAAVIASYTAGDLMLDAFVDRATDVFLVLNGHADLWQDPDNLAEPPDERLGKGDVFGYSAMLTERSVGPYVVAAGDCQVARLPAKVASRAFVTRQGAQFLAEKLVRESESRPAVVGVGGAEDLLRPPAQVLEATSCAADAARAITADGQGYAVVRLPGGAYGLVTDASLRKRVIVDGISASAPVTEVVDPTPPTAGVGDSSAELLLAMLDRGAQFVMVTEPDGALRGVVSLRDMSLTPIAADLSLHERIRRAATLDALIEQATRLPELLGQLLSGGLASGHVITVNSTLRDVIVRRAIELAMAGRPDLDGVEFTWLSLGSNGRREAVLSSDVDSAATFADGTSPAVLDGCRAVFAVVIDTLAKAGLCSDGHGVTASNSRLARTQAQWRAAAATWIAAPERNDGAIMLSLLVDGRPIYGDAQSPAAVSIINDLRTHPGTMRLLLQDTLSRRARMKTGHESLLRRPARFDIKRQAILPLVNIARWAALGVGSAELSTAERLRAAAGSPMMPDAQAHNLIDVFQSLQRLRLRYQLVQRANGERPSDTLTMKRMSPIDRSVIGQAVREIAAAQRRMANVALYVEADEWAGRTTG